MDYFEKRRVGRPKKILEPHEVIEDTRNGRDHIEVICGSAVSGNIREFIHDDKSVSIIDPVLAKRILLKIETLRGPAKHNLILNLHHSKETFDKSL